MKRTMIALIGAILATFSLNAQTKIQLQKESDGKYTVDAKVNGVGVLTYYVEENWFASMSSTTYLFLTENGYIADADIKGMTVLKMPDGSTTKAGSFVIRNLRLGSVIVKDLPAFVIYKQKVPLIIGSSTFDCFGEVSINGDILTINDMDEPLAAETPEMGPDTNLQMKAQACLEAKQYAEAAECFEKLRGQGEASMYTDYQYIMVLNILKRNEECLAMCDEWMGQHEGKSLTMDFWLHDAYGDCYARKGRLQEGIDAYQKAVETYCTMFGTTEKGIRKSLFRDETLGVTLFNLSKLYAAQGNIIKGQYYCSLAAKCGNQSAIEFCDNHKIKY